MSPYTLIVDPRGCKTTKRDSPNWIRILNSCHLLVGNLSVLYRGRRYSSIYSSSTCIPIHRGAHGCRARAAVDPVYRPLVTNQIRFNVRGAERCGDSDDRGVVGALEGRNSPLQRAPRGHGLSFPRCCSRSSIHFSSLTRSAC